ncbi:cytochrome C oxidase subunit IV family protein [Singulisphaera sp. PoT]|uniref:cytochrome C oxidase subunit IV family protein n=1 Tax=Singulisphaera sp. PoT TaxID=3411797 RepID=UPI003BF49B7E
MSKNTDHTALHDHVLPLSTYFKVYIWLMVFLLVTVGAAYVDLGPLNFSVCMIIATIKGVMIMLIFMHVKYSNKLVWVFAGASFLWLILLIVFSLNDYFTRDMLHIPGK